MAAGRLVAITGASGFVGSELAARFERDGWSVTRFTQAAREASAQVVPFHLDATLEADVFRSRGIEALVHCAYDFRPVSWADVHRVNVEGSRRLLAAARAGGVARIVVISSISAFSGSRSLYGRAKLEIEADAERSRGSVLRPGLVYGDIDTQTGGMLGNLRRSVRAPIVPLVGGGGQLQYLVHIDDLFRLVCRLCAGELSPPTGPVVVAAPRGLTVRELAGDLARRQGRQPRFVGVPWRAVWLGLKAAELVGLRPAYRSDSVVSLVHQDPHPDFAALKLTGAEVREFDPTATAQ